MGQDATTGGPGARTAEVPEPPRGRARLAWLGPAFLWMLSAAGSGELLFTPRVASLYGYALLWALLAAVALKWFVNREVGRWTVCTGETIIRGFSRVPGPRNWAVWAIVLPQLVVAVATIAGLGGAAATAVVLVMPGPAWLWTAVVILGTAAVVLLGQYGRIEKIAAWLAIVLTVAVVATAATVFPGPAELASGLVPRVPPEGAVAEAVPWLGFMLAGAAGLMWYSYWVGARGYGLAAAKREGQDGPAELPTIDDAALERLRGWLAMSTLANTLAVVGALLIAMAFLILGGELLRPNKLVPEESETAGVLGRMLGEVWGPAGYWFMIAAVFVTFCSTTLSDQDGFARLFADGTRILLGRAIPSADERRLRLGFIVVVLAAAPLGVYFAFGEPVGLLKVAGAVEAAHIPVVTFLTLWLNRRLLPDGLRPSIVSMAGTAVAGLFFVACAAFYLAQLAGLVGAPGGG